MDIRQDGSEDGSQAAGGPSGTSPDGKLRRAWRAAATLGFARRLSLRVRLALALSLAAALPLLLAVAVATAQQKREVRAEALARQAGEAQILAHAVADYVELNRASLLPLSDQPGLFDLPRDALRAQLQALDRSFPDFQAYAAYDAQGQPIVRSDDAAQLPIVGYPVFEQARSTAGPSLDVLVSPVYHQPIFAFGVPIRDMQGRFAGIVAAALPSTHVTEMMADEAAGQDSRAYLVDERGRAIAHPDPQAAADFADLSRTPPVAALLASKAESGSLEYAAAGAAVGPSEIQLVGYARVPGLNWAVVVEAPEASVMAGVSAGRLPAALILLLCLAGTMLTGALLAGVVTAPLEGLMAALREVAAEKEPAASKSVRENAQFIADTYGLKSSLPEITELASAFGDMRARLARRTAQRAQAEAALREANEQLRRAAEELEERVAERTAELSQANTQLHATLLALGESEERYRRLVEWAPTAVLVHCDGLITYANPAAAALFGAAGPEALNGLPIMERVDADYRGTVTERIHRVHEEGKVTPPLEIGMLRLDGSRVDVTAAGAPVTYQGRPAVQLVLLDVTARVRAEKLREMALAEREQARVEAERLAAQRAAILASMTEGLLIAGPDGAILEANPAALRMLGYRNQAEARGTLAQRSATFRLAAMDGRALGLDEWPMSRALRGESFTGIEISICRADEGRTWIASCGGAPVYDSRGEIMLAVVTLRDVTQQKQIEWEREDLLAEVAAARDELELRVEERTASLVKMTEELSQREASLREALAELEYANAELEQREVSLHTALESLEEANTELEQRGEELSRHGERLRILYEIDQAILAAHSPAEIAQASLDRVRQALRCDRASILMFETEAGMTRVLAASGVQVPGLLPGDCFHTGEWRVPPELLAGQVRRTADLAGEGDPVGIREGLQAAGFRARIQAPLRLGGEVIGVLSLVNRDPAGFAAGADEIAMEVALSMAIAIQNARLNEEVLASRSELQALSRRVVEVQENERRAVARELHDEAGQALTTLMIGLGLLEREAGESQVVRTRVAELKTTTDTVLEELHALAVNLRPASLDRLGLLPALRQYVDQFSRQTGLHVALESVGLKPVATGPAATRSGSPSGDGHSRAERFAPEVETTVYRVIQEALTNVARHAGATYAGILVERRSDALVAIVEDNGKGFDVEAAMARRVAPEEERLGLLGMRERAEMVGGTLTIESTEGQGTTVFIEVPI